MAKRWIRICPQCESTEVTLRAITRRAVSPNYACMSCGFQGPLFPEVSPAGAKKLKKNPKNINPTYLPILPDGATARKASTKTKWGAALSIILIFILLWLLSTY